MYEDYVEDIGDISGRVWNVKESRDRVTFESRSQLQYDKCSFELNGRRYKEWKMLPTSFNDFGGEYRHVAVRIADDPNP